MPRAAMAVTVLVALAVSTACSGGRDAGATAPPAANPARPAATASRLETLSSTDLMAEVKANLYKAKSVHVAWRQPAEGKGDTDFSFNFKVTATGKAVGVFRDGTDRVSIRRLGKVLYFKANRSYWNEDGSEGPGEALAGRWIKQLQGRKGGTDAYFEMTDMDEIIEVALDYSSEESLAFSFASKEGEPLTLVPGIDVGGQSTIGLADTKPGEETKESGTLYVSSADPTLPVHLKLGLDDTEYMKFRSWNEPVRVVAPKGAISLDS